MLKSIFNDIMERRAARLIEQVRTWLPADGPIIDVGSGTGHVSARLEREGRREVVTADVTDMHVTGRAPVLIVDGALPFEHGTFTAALLFFMLAYPKDPAGILAEAARVSRGPVIVVQTVYSGRIGYHWHRMREFFWTIVAFHVSKLVGYVPEHATFTMNTRRFYSAPLLEREIAAAGLRIGARKQRPVLPGNALVVVAWMLERDDAD